METRQIRRQQSVRSTVGDAFRFGRSRRAAVRWPAKAGESKRRQAEHLAYLTTEVGTNYLGCRIDMWNEYPAKALFLIDDDHLSGFHLHELWLNRTRGGRR